MSVFRQNTLERDSIPSRALSFEVWCYIRKSIKGRFEEKEWKVCSKATESIAKEHTDILQKKSGW